MKITNDAIFLAKDTESLKPEDRDLVWFPQRKHPGAILAGIKKILVQQRLSAFNLVPRK